MKIVKSIVKTVSMITFFSILTRFLGFIFRIFLSRRLGAEGMGIYQIASTVVGVFMTLVASGLPLTTAKMVAKLDSDNKKKEKSILTTSSAIIAIVISVISCIILILGKSGLNNFIKNDTVVDLIIIMSPALIFSAVYAIFRGALWGQNMFFWVSFTEFLEQLIRMILAFLVCGRLLNIIECTKALAFTFSLTCLISAIIVIIVYFINGGKLSFKKGYYKTIIKSATPITGVRLASSFVQPLTALLIPFLLCLIGYTNSEAISVYGIIMGMTFPLLFAPLSIVGSLSMVLIPKISILNADKQYDTIADSINKSIRFALFLAVLIIPLYLSCGDLIGVVLYDNIQAGIYLQLSAVCILPLVLNNITSSVLNALNLEVKSFINYIIGTIVMFVSLLTLTFVIRENAIIISFFLSSATTELLNMKMIQKKVPNVMHDLPLLLLKYALIILPCSVLGHLVSNTLYNVLPAFVAGLIGGGLSITSTLILVNMFNLYKVKTFKKALH